MNRRWLLIGFLPVLLGCLPNTIRRSFPRPGKNAELLTGSQIAEISAAFNWKQRDSLAVDLFFKGNIPAFWKKFKRVTLVRADSSGKKQSLICYVSPDYLAFGHSSDWVRMPVTPMAAQVMMDKCGAVFPNAALVDAIYRQATVKLKPIPLLAYRDSSVTMYQHHLMIEGQRKGRKGLTAGHKKDLVTSCSLRKTPSHNRVAIYGWHQPDGRPIQPLYTGHVNWYVDYSHGVRFVSSAMKLNGKKMQASEVFIHPAGSMLLGIKDTCGYVRY